MVSKSDVNRFANLIAQLVHVNGDRISKFSANSRNRFESGGAGDFKRARFAPRRESSALSLNGHLGNAAPRLVGTA